MSTTRRDFLTAAATAAGAGRISADLERHPVCGTLQVVPVADCAWNGLAGTAGLHERLSHSDAAGRNVSQKWGVWIAIRCSEWIFRRFDNAMTNRLRAGARNHKATARRSADVGFRRRAGFDHLHPGMGLTDAKYSAACRTSSSDVALAIGSDAQLS
jgi:hypothetical protein